MQQKIIPIFYSVDGNYARYLAVSLASLKDHADKNNLYKIYILHAGLSPEIIEEITRLQSVNFPISFVDVSSKIKGLKEILCLRDYFTIATYYRLVIPEIFTEYDKVLYLDSDTVALSDVAELYDTDLGNNFIGGAMCGTVSSFEEYRQYAYHFLGIHYKDYFNAGVILMNLKAMREEKFFDRFIEVAKVLKCRVAQDQDYLNYLCKGRAMILGEEWNKMPVEKEYYHNPKILHYNLTMKPWHYENVRYDEHFWYYAKKTEYYDELLKERENYTDEKKAADIKSEKALLQLAVDEVKNLDKAN